MTAAGIDDANVRPIFNPRKTFAAVNARVMRAPMTTPRTVNSTRLSRVFAMRGAFGAPTESPGMNNRLLIAGAAAVLLAACGHGSNNITVQNAVGGATVPPGAVVAPAGSSFFGKLSTQLGTKTSKDGDTFTLTETKGGALTGATIDGHVTGVVSAAPMRKPNMTLVFDDIRLADDTKEPVDVAIVSQRAFDPKSHHLRTIGMMIGGAMVGKHVGRGHAMLGALGGYAASQAIKTDIVVPAGATIELRLNQAVTSAATATPG